ncbi:MAG: radical SAM protein [Desulfurococcaceae archaeon]
MVKFRSIIVYETIVDSALSKSGLPDIEYALNPYLGCSHGCVYCYARLYTRDKRASINWGNVVVIKSNIVNVLEREVRRIKPGVIGVGTITDPYQPVEAVYKLTRDCLKILLTRGFKVSVQTKNTLVLRDVDIFSRYRDYIDVGFTITTLNKDLTKLIEPFSPPPLTRVSALRNLKNHGIKTWIFYGPIIPGLNDDTETIESIAKIAMETNSTLYYDSLHIKPFMKNPRYILYELSRGVNKQWWISIKKKILDYCNNYALVCKPGFTGDSH